MSSASENIDPADVELDVLVGLFFDNGAELGRFEDVDASKIDEPSRSLLAHDHHMTVTLERFHSSSVDVKVLATETVGMSYARKILLTTQSDGTVVQYGIVRLNFEYFDDEVREEILAQQIPLGRILINHDVMREVKLLNLYRIESGSELASEFGFSSKTSCFGRTAIIFCNGAPAIELLEIVGNC